MAERGRTVRALRRLVAAASCGCPAQMASGCRPSRNRDLYHPPFRPMFHFVRDLPSEIAVARSARVAVAQVVTKWDAQKPGFYEVCGPALLPGTPGA
jgi:hypothetical protein